MKINPEMFRGYDIRGISGKDLTSDTVYLIAKAFATFLYDRRIRECVIGYDVRETSLKFEKIFINVLLESGINVIDVGLSLAQIIYFAQYYYQSKSCCFVTASHNPREYNGFKLGVGFSDTLLSEEIQTIKEIAESGNFKVFPQKGSLREDDVFPAYKKDLFKRIPLHNCKFKVVIDGLNATAGYFLPEILREAGCEVKEYNTKLDSTFPLGTPDPTEKDITDRMGKEVLKEKANIGLTYDSDGDRIGIVDEEGKPVWNDFLLCLFAKDVLEFLPGSQIVINTLCSKASSETIKTAGGIPVMWKVGHSFIKAKVKETRSPFGGELSGHFFFMDNFYGHDDGAFATLRLLSFLKRKNQSLKEAVSLLPRYISSPEIKLGLADNIKFQLIDEKISKDVKEAFPGAEFITIDGIRADTEQEMVSIRASQNGPYITIKFEAKSKEKYEDLKKIISSILNKYKEIDWSQGVNIHAFELNENN